ncbi:hypothetical protein FBUS_10911 [Fasciolopsis buskii]|uniref:Uncharacterized protein n=1 Tax=Fasciolopsis buskii TaxID=27845 RepID=A0A8E0S4Q3_9TREM|nr:hypothetical protein FBUS_10911 [Fasciolopsis buski]
MNDVDLLNSSGVSTLKTRRKASRLGPYSMGEKKLLAELVGRARNTLRHVPTQMTTDQYRQIWVDISNCMHASGWPKRSWKRLRLKAQEMMSFPTEIGSLGPLVRGAPISRTDQCTNPSVDVNRTTITTSVPCISEPICSSILSTPPPLLSSSEASAETVIRLAKSIHSSVGVVNGVGGVVSVNGGSGGDGADVGGPQILHFCSRALSNGLCVDGFGRDTQSVNGPCAAVTPRTADSSAVVEVSNDALLNGDGRIELCISSDDDDGGENESDQKLPLNNHSTEKEECVNVECEWTIRFRSSSSSSDHPAQLTEADISKRIEIYDLKIEILKLKRAYWTQKLRSL